MPHPLTVSRPHASSDQLWTAATVGLALVAVVLAFAQAYDAGAVIAAIAVGAGGWSMLVSRTLTERFEIVTATVAAAVALAACLAFGSGFSL